MKLRPIKEVREEYPDFKYTWDFPKETIRGCKKRTLTHVVVCEDNGIPVYDTFVYESQQGVIIVPYNKADGRTKVGLIEEERVIPGRTFISLPMGNIEEQEGILHAANRELLEETGYSSKSLTVLGKNYAIPAFYRSYGFIVAAEIEDLESRVGFKLDQGEEILNVNFYTYKDIIYLLKSGKLEDGVTKAALFSFGCSMPEFFKE